MTLQQQADAFKALAESDLTDLRAMARVYFFAGSAETGDEINEVNFTRAWDSTPNYAHWRDEHAHELRVRELILAAAAWRRGETDEERDRLFVAIDDVVLQGDR